MSITKAITRPCRSNYQIRHVYLSHKQPIPQQRRHLSSGPLTGAAKAEVQSAHKYCLNLLSKYDRPSYTLSTFIPRPAQQTYLALRALNATLSLIPDTTSSYTIGLMRLQFWRDAISKTLAGSPPKEPIAILLASAIEDLHHRSNGSARLSRNWLNRMISAREQTLTNDPYPNLEALEGYAESTYSTLLYLTLGALPMTSVTADHVASHVGKAAGIAAVLRGLPIVAFPQQVQQQTQAQAGSGVQIGGTRQGAVMLPLDVMAQAGVKEEEVFRQGADAPGLRDAVFTVATRASDHLITVQQMLSNLRAGGDVGHDFEHEGEEGHQYAADATRHESPLDEVNRAFGIFMPAVATRLWLDRLESVDFDIFNPELLRSDWKLPWKAYMAFQRKSI
ncbi:Squalene/phytoene synthase [Aspergillus cavernicola]|uniref:Squalene/phytoene synthase n=1 Tax=Aspergillus cavernicola TaxID=176166 RepID=A0ABR4IQI5_9EURO